MGGLIALITNVTPTRTTTTINSKFRAMMPRYSIPNQRDSDPTVASPPRLNQRRRHHELRGRSESNSAELSCSLESGPARLSRWAILSIVKLEIEFMDL
ncbi:hypothetical protein L596_022072 [Steinernema carpocapsae]|uniref:Uncharacterized protein n=1 Tax=Steinernema carpocapsae TaxID=34508 RepID=A0A4U5MLH6_STECR|nr:hypothetical protein L596_022072 [Steinernema carpocapsae]